MPRVSKVTSKCPQWELNPISLNCITLVCFVTQPDSAPMCTPWKLILSVCEREEVLSNCTLRGLKEGQPQQQCGRQLIQSPVPLLRQSLRNQWALGSRPGLDISHVIASIILLLGDPISRGLMPGSWIQGKRGQILFRKCFWTNILPGPGRISQIGSTHSQDYRQIPFDYFFPAFIITYTDQKSSQWYLNSVLFSCSHPSNKYILNTYYVPHSDALWRYHGEQDKGGLLPARACCLVRETQRN